MIYDLAVLGAGPGGYVAAIRAGQLGAKVCLIEERELGGTCLNRGCIPSKAYFESAARMEALRRGAEFGVVAGEPGFDLAACAARKDRVVERLVGGVRALLRGAGVRVVEGRGVFASPNRIRVHGPDGETMVEARRVIVATGSRPAEVPNVAVDGRRVLTGDGIWDLVALPRRMVVLGGGVIGCEVAHIFAAFGTRVTVLEVLERILAEEEREASRTVHKTLERQGVEIRTGLRVAGAQASPSQAAVTLEGGEELRCDCVVVAAGRSPNGGGIGLEEAGVKVGGDGRVVADEGLETSVPGVYAVGDVAGPFLLAHVATSQGRVAAHNSLGGSYAMDYSVVPYAVFTSPEVASVGWKEGDLDREGTPYRVGRFSFTGSGKPLCMGRPEGFAKLLSHAETGRILGATVVGAHASDVIGEVAVAMHAGAGVRDVAGTIHVHPTVSEVLLEAAEDTLGLAVHKPQRSAKRG